MTEGHWLTSLQEAESLEDLVDPPSISWYSQARLAVSQVLSHVQYRPASRHHRHHVQPYK